MKYEKLSLAELERESLAAFNAGRMIDAVNFGGQALKLAPTNDVYRMRYAYFIEAVKVRGFDIDIRSSLTHCLRSEKIDHQRLSPVWNVLVTMGPSYRFLFDTALDERKYWKSIDTLLNDDFFQLGIRKMLMCNPFMEEALIRLRRALLNAAQTENMLRGKHLSLLASLGIQNFYNEYVWAVSDEEMAQVEKLDLSNAVQVALLSCYKPLFRYNEAEEWLSLYGKGPLETLMRVQIADCLEEQRIKNSLQALSAIEETTSQAVQAMYEENPYPRWTHVDVPFKIYNHIEADWLTAGCGTGRPLSQLGVAFPRVNFTAIDLSRSSLGYAVRKTRDAGISNIDFYHGDLMNVGQLGKTFDFIESSGVLHHMKDPVAGWKALLAQLRPGGRMQIGLYSTKAREVIWKVREHIEKNGYEADLNGIRQLRSEMFALPSDHPLHPITERHDFYAASECRDLVFHIQETTYTIPEIRRILDDLGLAFLYFKLSPREKAIYQKHYPEDESLADLDNWHALEQKYPQLFAGMYKFFCCRKSEVESPLEKFVILEKTGFLRGY